VVGVAVPLLSRATTGEVHAPGGDLLASLTVQANSKALIVGAYAFAGSQCAGILSGSMVTVTHLRSSNPPRVTEPPTTAS
jgi:hypothetical protein